MYSFIAPGETYIISKRSENAEVENGVFTGRISYSIDLTKLQGWFQTIDVDKKTYDAAKPGGLFMLGLELKDVFTNE